MLADRQPIVAEEHVSVEMPDLNETGEQLNLQRRKRGHPIGTERLQLMDQQRQFHEAQNMPRIGRPPLQQDKEDMEVEEMSINLPKIRRRPGRPTRSSATPVVNPVDEIMLQTRITGRPRVSGRLQQLSQDQQYREK